MPTGDWTGESGLPLEPGTYYGNLAAKTPKSTVLANAGLPGNTPLDDNTFYRYLYATQNGPAAPGGGATGAYKTQITGSGSGGGGRGGGGGGGAAAAPTLSQAQLDWAMSALGHGPQQQQAGPAFNAPAYNGPALRPFDGSRYDQLQQQLGQAVNMDKQTATQAYGDLTNYLNTNYRNAYSPQATQNFANMGNATGADQAAMQRMLAAQGVPTNLGDSARNGAAGADQAFGNLLAILGGNEDNMQRNRLGQVQMDANQTGRVFDYAQLQGNTAIGQQRANAQDQYQQRADDRDYQNYNTGWQAQQQAALANWQRQNQVSDTNNGNDNSFRNAQLTQLFSLLPSIIGAGNGKLNLPDLASLFGGAQ